MAIKECKEFFLRSVAVNSGSKRDREIGFPTSTSINDCCNGSKTVGNRFLAEHFATNEARQKFFESIPFFLNPEDKATTSQQGLVKLATDSEAVLRSIDPIYTLGITPYQMLELFGNTIEALYYDIDTGIYYDDFATVLATGHKFRLAYKILSAGGAGEILLLNDITEYSCDATSNPLLLIDYDLATTSYFKGVGDKLEISVIIKVLTSCTFEIRVGSKAILQISVDAGVYDIYSEINKLSSNSIKCINRVFRINPQLLSELFTVEVHDLTSVSITPSINVGLYGNNVTSDGDLLVQKFEIKSYNL